MFSRVAASSVRIAARGARSASTVSTEAGASDFKKLRDATKAHAGGKNLRPLEEDQGAFYVKQVEDEHHHHLQHLK
ncbi:hypothetical protein QFC22_001676 [Naganishia vaughanmartiniae]|uniref:Uncharacterized protein n=1 Tax=Naganishia vaughanmartiniae TaxID=1424756 RepID=A0ACC2XF41_9TREE|nr:hypothetical protein QFC22_001676 [Naganishia vaughanmartiniae]